MLYMMNTVTKNTLLMAVLIHTLNMVAMVTTIQQPMDSLDQLKNTFDCYLAKFAEFNIQ